VLAVGCAKYESKAAPAQAAAATPGAASGELYEVLVEEKEEAPEEAADESKAEKPAEPESEPAKVVHGDRRYMAPPAAAPPPPPAPKPSPTAAAAAPDGLALEGSGGGGTIEKIKAYKGGGFGKRKAKRVRREERKRHARKVVSKKTIAGAFMQAGADTKLFAEGGEGDGLVVGGAMGDMDADDGGAVARGPLGGKPAKRPAAKFDATGKANFKGKDALLQRLRKDGKKERDRRGLHDGRGEADKNGWMHDSEEDIDQPTEPRPDTFLPRMCYFENTYLGGNAAYLERLRRLDEAFSGDDRVYRKAKSTIADVDAPAVHGLALTASLSRRSFKHEGKVYLQIGLRGSNRYGWRRPPLDIAVVVDQPALAATRDGVSDILLRLIRDLGAQDRVTVHVVGGGPEPFLAATPANQLRFRIAEKVDALQAGGDTGTHQLGATIAMAGRSLAKMSGATHRIPGAQIALLLVDGRRLEGVATARNAAHKLTLQGAVTSVMAVGGNQDQVGHGWWQVANAGHGSYRLVQPGGEGVAVRAELDALARVVARLIRVNVRLGPRPTPYGSSAARC